MARRRQRHSVSRLEVRLRVGAKGVLEDRVVIAPRVLAVIDGAGSPEPLWVGEQTGGSWAADFLASEVSMLDPRAADLVGALLAINARMRVAMKQAGVDPEDKARVPAASLVVACWSQDGTCRLVQVGDCVAGLQDNEGQFLMPFRMQQEPWEREALQRLDALRRRGADGITLEHERRALSSHQRAHIMNALDGFGTLAGDPAVEAHIREFETDSSRLVLASDGLDEGSDAIGEQLRRVILADRARPLLDGLGEPASQDDLAVLAVEFLS